MILPHIETDRPIPSERAMRQVKHTQSRNRKEKSQPSEQGMKAVSCETRYIIVAGLVLSIIGRGSATVVDKGTDTQRSCELLVQNSFRNQDEARSAGACEGMIETAMLFSPNLPAGIRACPPTQGSILQSAKVFLRYIDNNPDRVNEPGITIAIEAFRDAWPCQGDDAESSIGTGPKKHAPKKSKQ
jgi:hypothetical protein